jgi:hypothetical protein
MGSERNQKQVELMKQHLAAFIEGGVELGELITRLETVLGKMENAPPAWQNACFRHVANLASIYAEAVCKKSNELKSQQEEVLIQNVYELIKLSAGC